MKSVFSKLIMAGLLFFFISPAHASSRGFTIKAKASSGTTKEIRLYSGYHELVVGCGDYWKGWPKLPNPVKDAREVARTLKQLGWKVNALENPGSRAFRRAPNKLIAGPGKDKNMGILVWYSGHGHTLEEAGEATRGTFDQPFATGSTLAATPSVWAFAF